MNVVGIGNASVGNSSSNNPGQPPAQPRPVTPPRPAPPKPVERADAPLPETDVELAHTGSGPMGYAVPTSAALLLGGAMLYRRARAAAGPENTPLRSYRAGGCRHDAGTVSIAADTRARASLRAAPAVGNASYPVSRCRTAARTAAVTAPVSRDRPAAVRAARPLPRAVECAAMSCARVERTAGEQPRDPGGQFSREAYVLARTPGRVPFPAACPGRRVRVAGRLGTGRSGFLDEQALPLVPPAAAVEADHDRGASGSPRRARPPRQGPGCDRRERTHLAGAAGECRGPAAGGPGARDPRRPGRAAR